MQLKSLSNQVYAFAGVYQACQQVKNIAWHGRYETTILNTTIGSIFKIDAADLGEIYGGYSNLAEGLKLIRSEYSPSDSSTDTELMRYILNLLTIEKKVSRTPAIANLIRQAVDKAATQLKHFGTEHPNTWAALADIYQRTVSQMAPKIMVVGERAHLSNETNAAKIRALLLGALRSAVLWRQCGGSRLSLLFCRRKYYNEASVLLKA